MQVIDFVRGKGYEVISFPDGEKHLRIQELNRKDTVAIRCRIKSSDDLFLLMQLSDILNRQCVEVEEIEIFYLMSMRCDRLFSFEQPFSLKIVADVINSFNAKNVYIYEPHSHRCLDMIKNSRGVYLRGLNNTKFNECDFCFPDSGAYKRYSTNIMSLLKPIICKKVRDVATGKLLSFDIVGFGSYKEGNPILVIDDLCDGGGTFCGIAEILRPLNPQNISLFVTHAVQKAGIEKVAKYYDKVYITNSYEDWNDLPDNVEVINIIE